MERGLERFNIILPILDGSLAVFQVFLPALPLAAALTFACLLLRLLLLLRGRLL